MVADFLTKPLQGTLFKQMHDRIMNIDSSSRYHSNHRSVLEKTDANGQDEYANGQNVTSATSTVTSDENTTRDIGTMSYRDAVVNKE